MARSAVRTPTHIIEDKYQLPLLRQFGAVSVMLHLINFDDATLTYTRTARDCRARSSLPA